MPITLSQYPDLDHYKLGIQKTGNSFARGDQTFDFIAKIPYNSSRPAKIELTLGAIAVDDETVSITSPVEITLYRNIPIAVGNGLGTTDVIDGVIVVAENIVIPATTATTVKILPYAGTAVTAYSTAAIYQGLTPVLSIEDATFPQISSDMTTTQNKSQFFKTADKTTGSWTSNFNGSIYREDPALPILEDSSRGWGKLYFMVTQAPYDTFVGLDGAIQKYGAGPAATEAVVVVTSYNLTNARADNQKLSCAITGDGDPFPYSILIPDF